MRLKLEYVRLDNLLPNKNNPKQHDIGQLYELIKQYSFLDPIIANKVRGKYHILAGHGRVETLYHVMQAHEEGLPLPDGLDVDEDGMLLAPVMIGKRLKKADAEGFIIDHNNSTLGGGDFTALDQSRLYDMDAYLELLKTANTLTVDEDDIDLMLRLASNSSPEPPEAPKNDYNQSTHTLTLSFVTKAEKNEFTSFLDPIGDETNGQALLRLLNDN